MDLAVNIPDYYRGQFTYKELSFVQFHETYGDFNGIQFVSSDLLTKSDFLFSKFLVISYRQGNLTDSIIIFPFEKILSSFNEIRQEGCQYSDLLWPRSRLDTNMTECLFANRTRINFIMKKLEIEGYIWRNIISGEWNRIIDFVPLALEATPGYVILVLSSDINYTKYRYSIHFIDNSNSTINHPVERIFNLNFHPNNQAKIYYFALPTPKVLISIDHWHYSERLVMCPFLKNSCLDCVTMKIFDNDHNFLNYCSWTSGICSETVNVVDSYLQKPR